MLPLLLCEKVMDQSEIIKEIALKHGVALGPDDPILIMTTIHEKMLEESKLSQEMLLNTLRSEIEEMSTRWSLDAKKKADLVLNAALDASTTEMAAALNKASMKSSELIGQHVAGEMMKHKRQLKAGKLIGFCNIAASFFTLLAVIWFALNFSG